MTYASKRPGEEALPFDPATVVDGTVAFIGHLCTPWKKGHCPKNLTEARSMGGPFKVHIGEAYRGGLVGIAAGMPVILLYWLAAARRDLVMQTPKHRPVPSGTFSLRSPARPNPIAMAVVTVLEINSDEGLLTIDACDAFNGTQLLDIKPWLPRVDLPLRYLIGT